MWPQRFGKHLIFNIHTGYAHFNQALDNGRGVDGIAAAGVDIGHHRNCHGAGDMARDIEDVFHVHQADIGPREQAAGEAETAHLDGFKSGALDNAGAQGVVTSGHDKGLAAI